MAQMEQMEQMEQKLEKRSKARLDQSANQRAIASTGNARKPAAAAL
jgi:hypothetical protein